MSKIAEEKAKIAFREFLARHNWSGNIELGYKMGYDQAMQDRKEAFQIAYQANQIPISLYDERGINGKLFSEDLY